MDVGDFDALLVLSFGGPQSASDVVPFLERVTAGRGVPPERLAVVAGQYAQLGGVSPLNAENRRLVHRLREVAPQHWLGERVYLANRNSEPFLIDALSQMSQDGIRRAAVFITSAYSSYSGCRQYLDNLAEALSESGLPLEFCVLPRFHDHQMLVDIWADRIVSVRPHSGSHLIFVTHSLPVVGSDRYLAQHLALAGRIAERIPEVTQERSGEGEPAVSAASRITWELAFQSRSGSPAQSWLEPDICDVIRSIGERTSGVSEVIKRVVVAPIGFCALNMEILWDLDHLAAGAAKEVGLGYLRAEPPQSDPRFVEMIMDLVGTQPAPRCSSDCCPNPRGRRPVAGCV